MDNHCVWKIGVDLEFYPVHSGLTPTGTAARTTGRTPKAATLEEPGRTGAVRRDGRRGMRCHGHDREVGAVVRGTVSAGFPVPTT